MSISKADIDTNHYKWIVPRSDYKYSEFTEEEYRRRWKLVKDFMARKDFNVLLVNGGNIFEPRGWFNMKWLSNYMGTLSTSSYLVIPAEGEPMISDSLNCAQRPDRRARSRVELVRGGDPVKLAIERVKELKLDHGKIGIVEAESETFQLSDYNALTTGLPEVKFEFVTDEFEMFHLQKSPEEISAVEKAAGITDLAIQALKEKAKPGMKEHELFAIVSDAYLRAGAEYPSMILLASQSMENPNTCMGRLHPIDRTLKKGDIIITEIGAREERSYEAQTGKPICLGEPNKEFREMYEACLAAFRNCSKAFRPGCTDDDVKAAARVVLDRGFHWETPILHGMQPPGIPMTTFKGPRPRMDPLKEGTIVVLETSACRHNLSAGLMLDDTFVITSTGNRRLNKIPPEIIVI